MKTKSIILAFILILFLPINIKASTMNKKVLDSQNVDNFKVWNIRFTKDLNFDMNTIKSINVYDKNNKLIEDVTIYKFNKNTITVYPPKYGYNVGESYLLRISGEVKSVEGEYLNKEIDKPFLITSVSTQKLPPFEKNTDLPSLNIGVNENGNTVINSGDTERSMQEILNISKKVDKPEYNKYQKEAIIYNYEKNFEDSGDMIYRSYILPQSTFFKIFYLTNTIDNDSRYIAKRTASPDDFFHAVKINGKYYYIYPSYNVFNYDEKTLKSTFSNISISEILSPITAAIWGTAPGNIDDYKCDDSKFTGIFESNRSYLYDNKYLVGRALNENKYIKMDLTNFDVTDADFVNGNIRYSDNTCIYTTKVIDKTDGNRALCFYKINPSDNNKSSVITSREMKYGTKSYFFSGEELFIIDDDGVYSVSLKDGTKNKIFNIETSVGVYSTIFPGWYYIYFYNDKDNKIYQIDKMNYNNVKVLADLNVDEFKDGYILMDGYPIFNSNDVTIDIKCVKSSGSIKSDTLSYDISTNKVKDTLNLFTK